MDKLMLSLDTGKTDVFLRKCITTKYGEKIHVKNISVLWKYKNIVTNDNDLIKFITVPDHPATGVTFEEGYWTFNMIADRLSGSGITNTITVALFFHQKSKTCIVLDRCLGSQKTRSSQKIPNRSHRLSSILTADYGT